MVKKSHLQGDLRQRAFSPGQLTPGAFKAQFPNVVTDGAVESLPETAGQV
jgi:hypothetical protein